uniref:Lipase domain-containing protein n=1 Tax=Clastoptera arizonana TaxID=38151 RepID=A0A1B6CJQ3_9HEMI
MNYIFFGNIIIVILYIGLTSSTPSLKEVQDLDGVFLRVYTIKPTVSPWLNNSVPRSVVPSLYLNLTEKEYLQTKDSRYQGEKDGSTYYVEDIPIKQKFDVSKIPYFSMKAPTAVYIHGYIETSSSLSVRTVVDAYLQRGDHNIIVVDWGVLANKPAVQAAIYTNNVGQALAMMIDGLVSSGYDASLLHLIGHSMGAHVAGFVGNYFKGGRIRRITALDPVGVGFYATKERALHLDKSDADFLDVIHTDANHYGIGIPIGHVDSYANGGTRIQPGCPKPEGFLTPSDLCSHWLSWRLYSESLVNTDENTFLIGMQCQSWSDFLYKNCVYGPKMHQTIRVGYNTPLTGRGMYFFKTNSTPKYGKGMNGI